jgi:hypothetical protein
MRRNVIFAFMFLSISVFKANAAQIRASNVSWNGSSYDYSSSPDLIMITGENFFEKIVFPEDTSWILGPENPNLQIWSQEPNDSNKMGVSKKPYNTPGWEVYLGVRGTIAGPISNDIEVRVEDTSGLEHRKLIAYDSNDPNTVYELHKSDWYIIPLPALQNKQDEVYAIWIFATPPNVPGDIAGPNGLGKLDGKVDFYDLGTLCDRWLDETSRDENYSWGDLDFSRMNDFRDFAVIANNWLKEE